MRSRGAGHADANPPFIAIVERWSQNREPRFKRLLSLRLRRDGRAFVKPAPYLSYNRFCSTFPKSGVNQMSAVQSEALELFSKKNADYGDAFATYGPIGVIVRMGDKINRLVSINQNGVTLVDSESVLNRFA